MTQVHQEIQDLLEVTRRISVIPDDAVAYLPDLSNPDPIAALEEAWKFENWMISVDPHPEWVPFYAVPNGPYAGETESELDTWITSGYRVEDFSDSYYFEDAEVVALDDIVIPDNIRAQLPLDATAVVFIEGANARIKVDRDTSEVLGTLPAFGPDRVLTILTPTAKGWRIYYSEIGYDGPQ